MNKHVPDVFLSQKQNSCRRELVTIRGFSDPTDQVTGYRALLYDVLMWQGLTVETSENIFTIMWKERSYYLLFWPSHRETIDQKLGLKPVNEILSRNQAKCILTASLVGFTQDLYNAALKANGQILLLDGTDIDALCGMEWSFSQMMDFKVREMAFYGQPNVNYLTYSAKQREAKEFEPVLTSLETWLSKGRETDAEMFREDALPRWIDFEHNVIIEWPQFPEALQFISERPEHPQALIISGAAGSGKSTFLYTIGYHHLLTSKAPVYYYNVANLQMSNIRIVVDEIINLSEGSMVLLDDLHQRAVYASKVIGAILSRNTKVKIVAATRQPYFTEAQDKLQGPYGWRSFEVKRIDLEPSVIADKLISRFAHRTSVHLSQSTIQRLKYDVGQDITVLGWVLRHIETDKTNASLMYDEAVVRYRCKPLLAKPELGAEALSLLYTIAFFEQFDVRIHEDYLLKLGFSGRLTKNLLAMGYLTQLHETLGIGHANLARLYIRTLDKHTDLSWMPAVVHRLKAVTGKTPTKIEEIKIGLLDTYFDQQQLDARSRAILNVFYYFAPNVHPTQLHQDMIYMVSAIERAMDLLILYFQRDPTGENSVSNSAFMCQVFTKLGRIDLARQALDFILAQQEINKNDTAQFILDPLRITTVKDFEEIRKRAALEDQSPDDLTIELLNRVYSMQDKVCNIADQVDFNQFHQTWLSAMVLPSIAAVYGKEYPRFNQTLKTVLANQDQDKGGFYPLEFCWSTARCVTNLAHVGLPLDSSPIVGGRDWLLRLQLDDGRWHSPDWRWNPDEEMTAMCLYALLRAGLAYDHPAVGRAKKWLLSRQRQGCWNNNAHDTSHVIEALNALSFPLDELREPLRFLERRVSTDDWYQTIIGKERRQSLEIGELANVLLDVETRYLFDYVRETLVSE
ncbi:MAG: hypothetical protein DRP09_16165 [Candidatus Thorarchaeota archaeon]|nr:MAG: hypothetical protein DRP09_16165 [Candidatus Thorarchaeota archaeon]